MSNNPILGFFEMNRLATMVTPPGDANTVKNAIFRTFRAARTARRQALVFSELGATDFSSLCSFRKIAFPDSLTIRFR